jgi:hypothetical protein
LDYGDWWDTRTWFNSGFTESWSASSQSIWQAAKAENWSELADAYDDSSHGQSESIGGGVYTAEKGLLTTATTATAAATFGLSSPWTAMALNAGLVLDKEGAYPNHCPAAGTVRRVTNPKHNPNSNSPEPRDADDLWNRAIEDKNGVRWAMDEDGIIHRFSKPSNDESHWNGSTAEPNPILKNNIPNDILKSLEE